MRKIFVRVKSKSNQFLEIVDLKQLWIDTLPSGILALMYKDSKQINNPICYSIDRKYLCTVKETIEKAYANGDHSVDL